MNHISLKNVMQRTLFGKIQVYDPFNYVPTVRCHLSKCVYQSHIHYFWLLSSTRS